MLLDEIATRFLQISYEGACETAKQTAREATLDTVGVTLAGCRSDAAVRVGAAFSSGVGGGPSTLFGLGRNTDALSATLLNGTAAHAHDFDDCSNTMGGHPSAPVVPALWALSEARNKSGAALLSAYVAAVEVETRLGRAVNFHHYEKGWHPTATLGTFGAAAGSAHLIGLDPVRSVAALAIAASMASGLKANFGTMTKPFHVGHASRNGLAAALMAEAGVTASADALEHPQGFFAVFDEGQVDPEAILEGWADPLDLVEPGIALKRHPCCASTHPAIDALLLLREEHGLTWANVRSIRSWTHPRRLRHTDRPRPTTGLEAKFSVQYVLTRALERGSVAIADFGPDALSDPLLQERMARVIAEPHPDADPKSTEHFFAEVTVTLTDGREFSRRVERPFGRDRDHPLPAGAIERKFLDCAEMALHPAAARELRDALLSLDTLADIAALAPLLAGIVDQEPEVGTA